MINLNVNGQSHSVSADADTPLLWVLRDELKLTGSKFSCGIGACGACTVLVNGEPTRSCVLPVSAIGNSAITTIEGLAKPGVEPNLALHPVQKAFSECHALQCGFCTPGMIMSSVDLLNKNANPSDDEIIEALEGNLCRCTGYINIVSAVRVAAQIMREETVQ